MGEVGEVGKHEVADSQSAPGAICRFAPPLVWSLGETWVHVRPPMMFANDVTSGPDRQLVGWRAVVLTRDRTTGAWEPIAIGKTQRALATEISYATFESRSEETQVFLGYGAYRVRIELFWYENAPVTSELRVAGKAAYEIEHYAIVVRHRQGMRQIGVSDECRFLP